MAVYTVIQRVMAVHDVLQWVMAVYSCCNEYWQLVYTMLQWVMAVYVVLQWVMTVYTVVQWVMTVYTVLQWVIAVHADKADDQWCWCGHRPKFDVQACVHTQWKVTVLAGLVRTGSPLIPGLALDVKASKRSLLKGLYILPDWCPPAAVICCKYCPV